MRLQFFPADGGGLPEQGGVARCVIGHGAGLAKRADSTVALPACRAPGRTVDKSDKLSSPAFQDEQTVIKLRGAS
jgi:hypothetical protein